MLVGRRARPSCFVKRQMPYFVQLHQKARLVALSRTGRQLDSRAFAMALDQWRQNPRDLAFLVGGAYGLGDAVQERCDDAIRLSDLTLPHELARVVLLEQIYRGNSILKGEPYHKSE